MINRNIVLWRDEDGSVQVVENYCPHRGAPLSLGYVCEGLLTCAYHGLQIDGQGVIAATPPMPGSPYVGEKAIKSYPVREFADAIWVYFGDALHEAAPEPIFPEEIPAPGWSSFLFTVTWECNWQVALDNRLDPIHGSYLHDNTFTLAWGRKDADLKIKKTKHGFRSWRSNQRGVNIDWNEVTLHPDNIFWIKTEIPYPIPYGSKFFRINGHPTPIDRDHVYVWFYRSCEVIGWERDMWRFLYKNRLIARHNEVAAQDAVLLQTIPLQARQREKLLTTDVAVARMRQMMRKEAERQLAAMSSLDREAAE